jgi:DNA-binding NarL/FixJ family response regulator
MLDHYVETAASLSPGVVAGSPRPVRRHLAIVDQSRLRSDCLKLALGMQPRRWHVVDVAAVSELIQRVLHGEEFDVILLGGSTCSRIELGDICSLAASVPQKPILVAADCDDPERAQMILRAGARGFLPSSYSLKVLVGALERVRTGGTYVPLTLTELGTGAGQTAPHEPWRALTRRQCDVLALIAEGKANKLIAAGLKMSESTVKAHVKQIIRRLNVANRTQAALLATGCRTGH